MSSAPSPFLLANTARFRRFALLSALALAVACTRAERTPPGGGGALAIPAVAARATAASDTAKSPVPQTTRPVIRRAELGLEVASPAAAESKASSLVERLGGYIESSERELLADEGARSEARVLLSLRVPAERLEEALRELKRLGSGAETEKISAEDVTDELIDLGARIANQRHLEQQLVTLLAQANDVDSALKVHQELTAARTEIDRLEGRKRLLDTESAFAKLTPRRPVVSASSTEFGVSLRRAAADSVTVAAAVVTFSIRATGVLAPLGVMFGLPALGLSLWLRRRRRKLATALAV